MPIKSYWIKKPYIISVDCLNHVTEEDINSSARGGVVLANENPFYMLIDTTNNNSLPRNLVNLSFSTGEWSQLIKHPNMRAFAFVNASPTLRLAATTAIRHTDLIFVDNREDGISFLQEKLLADSGGRLNDDDDDEEQPDSPVRSTTTLI